MSLEVIKLRSFAEPDRSEVQRRVAQQVEQDPEKFLARYAADPRSHNGRYVNSDLMKEMFDEYRESRKARSRYNTAVHNAAAVLASEQFRRAIADDSGSSRDTAIFLTGIPGAGKTSHVLRGGELSPFVRVLYEGQLAKPEQALEKISIAVDLGLRTKIFVVHIQPERALQNTLDRFKQYGRGASIEAMASIQGNLPESLEIIKRRFGNFVDFRVIDRRATLERELLGWQHLAELRSEGNYEHIKQNLTRSLRREYGSGRITQDAYEQGMGSSPGKID